MDTSVAPGWPVITYETLPWESRSSQVTASRNERRRQQGPYRAAVTPPIAGAEVSLPGELAALVQDASTEMTRFDESMGWEIGHYAGVLLRTESAASSRIENLTASARAIAEAEIGQSSRRNAAEIVANTRSMTAAVAMAERIDAASVLAMHDALMRDVDPEHAGRWRQQQVWIGGGNLGPQGALFVPPHHSRIGSALSDLFTFIGRTDLPPLAHAALAHAQFETIHPFPDGNGRTGRALLHAMLREEELTRNVTVPVSAGLLSDIDDYYAALTSYREGDPFAIIRKVSVATLLAVGNGRRLIEALRGIRGSWNDRIVARNGSATWRIADLALRRPVMTAQVIAEDLTLALPNVYRSLEPLASAGILVESTGAARNRVWRAPEILRELDAFAIRAGRRTLG